MERKKASGFPKLAWNEKWNARIHVDALARDMLGNTPAKEGGLDCGGLVVKSHGCPLTGGGCSTEA